MESGSFKTVEAVVRAMDADRPVVLRRRHCVARAVEQLGRELPGLMAYAIKANGSPWLIEELARCGVTWFEAASTEEVRLVAAHAPGARIAYMNPIKSRASIRYAYREAGCRLFALDCRDEFQKIREETGDSKDVGVIVRAAIDNAGALLPLTGKFGASALDLIKLLREARDQVETLGVSFHVGSQCLDPEAFTRAIEHVAECVEVAGVSIDHINVGGGFPAAHPGHRVPPVARYGEAIRGAIAAAPSLKGAVLMSEPGRGLSAEAESLLVQVLLRKNDRLYVNDGPFGALYDAAHYDWPYPMRVVRPDSDPDAVPWTPFKLFGPTCDSADKIDEPVMLPMDTAEGEYIEIGLTGAYGLAMSTRFNGFGLYDAVDVEDDPWPSAYALETAAAAAPETQPA